MNVNEAKPPAKAADEKLDLGLVLVKVFIGIACAVIFAGILALALYPEPLRSLLKLLRH